MARRLLKWYARRGRHGLPWRGAFEPYRILVSEFMLQQTTVGTVVPYFRRFIKKFPTVRKLASAPLERVLKAWSGLGYYARARNLRAAARAVVQKHGGRLPRTREEMQALPGVGPYTAGALLSFAYNRPEPLVDGNVVRVLSRVFGIRTDVKRPETIRRIWNTARKLVPRKGTRHFNSALMDLGALICRPAGPDCPACPLHERCWAFRHGQEDSLPLRSGRKAPRRVRLFAAAARKGARWLMVRRPLGGLYGGLWEFPGVEAVTLEEAVDRLGERTGIALKHPQALPGFIHVLSHRELHVRPLVFSVKAVREPKEGAWRTLAQAERMAVSSLTRKIIGLLRRVHMM